VLPVRACVGEELCKLEYSAREGWTEVVALSENVAHDQRAETLPFGSEFAPVAEVHVGEGIRHGASGDIDDISRSQKAIAAMCVDVEGLDRGGVGACAETGRIAATKNNAIAAAQTAISFFLLPALLKVDPPTAFAVLDIHQCAEIPKDSDTRDAH